MSTFYQSFLLRLRRVNNAGRPVWRFSLESAGSPENHQFQNLDELYAFLLECMQEVEEVERPHRPAPDGDDGNTRPNPKEGNE
jgi:hypothetical protein